MFIVFTLLFFLSGLLLIIGLIRPKVFQKITKSIPNRKKVTLVFGGLIVISFIGMMFTVPPVDKKEGAVNQPVAENNIATYQSTSTAVENTSTSTDPIGSVADNQSPSVNPAPSQTDNSQTASNNQPTTEVSPQPIQNQGAQVLYSVSSVVDGDTVKVNINGTVATLRLIGINTPETVDPRTPVQCFGKEASDRAKALLSGKKVRLEADSTQGELDKYSRLLRYVYLEDGTFFNEKMISDGYAYEYTYNSPYKYQSQFKAAQADAKKNLRGLWSPSTCNGILSMPATAAATAPASTQNTATTQTTQSSGKYYTSSYYTSKYYYPEACSAWQGLSAKYLKLFDSLNALLKSYPTRTLSPQCQ